MDYKQAASEIDAIIDVLREKHSKLAECKRAEFAPGDSRREMDGLLFISFVDEEPMDVDGKMQATTGVVGYGDKIAMSMAQKMEVDESFKNIILSAVTTYLVKQKRQDLKNIKS